MRPPVPANESGRLEALRRYPSADSVAEREFDDLTFLASLVCQTPIALITLIEADRQCFKSRVGMEFTGSSRDIAFCAHAIVEPDTLMVIGDMSGDPRFADNPLVVGEPRVRFYAAQPLVSADGYALGTLCVMDRIPRDLTCVQREALGVLARQVVAQFELRRDVAERRQTERALLESRSAADAARAAAEQASQAKSFFLANMSHELRTPLNAIIGYSEMIQEEMRESGLEQHLADLEKILVAGKHLLATINDVLDLSKIEAGKAHLHIEAFDVDLMVRDVIGVTRPVIEANGNRMEVSRETNLGTMKSDAVKVRQCLINLLANAGKFTDRGIVRLEVARSTHDGRDWVTFRVSDTGIGMTPAHAAALFEPFVQPDEETARRFGGTGLGLALTRRFSRLLGGDVSVQTESGRGSTFILRLPDDAPSAAPAVSAVAPLRVEQASPRDESADGHPAVLIIDDDQDACELLVRLLSREGYRCVCASGGQEGLRRARADLPDIIILDVVMPEMDGWATLASIKADPELAAIPVVMCTVMDEPRRALALGVTDYLVKPIDRNRLIEALDRHRPDRTRLPILVVEDDADARELIRRTLATEGWRVAEAGDGIEALHAVAERRPSLIVLDLMMPRMDGFEFVATLRRTESWRSIPIFVMTAREISDEDRRALDGSVQRIFKKFPWSREELLTAVAEQIHGLSKQAGV